MGSNKGNKMCHKVVEIKENICIFLDTDFKENTDLLELPHWFVQKEECYFNLLYMVDFEIKEKILKLTIDDIYSFFKGKKVSCCFYL